MVENRSDEERYRNANETNRLGLRLLEEENKIKVLRTAVQEGIESGIAQNFNPKKQLVSLKASN